MSDHAGRPTDRPEPAPERLWVRSELLPDGSYGVGLSLGEDRAWVLARGAAVRHATAVIAAATAAEHDSALVATLRAKDMPETLIGQVLVDVREGRDETRAGATRPLRLTPGVSMFTGGPFLRVHVDGVEPWRWSPADARRHAFGVLQSIAAADLDGRLRDVLVGNGVPPVSVRELIGSMGEHWPTEDAR